MTLSAAEAVEVRRQAGYPAAGVAPDDALAAVLAGLSTEGEAVIRTTFLPALTRLELAIIGATETLGTAKAAVWERNAAEVYERTTLYRSVRLTLCRFLGIEPGPGILDMIIVAPGTDTGTDTGGGGLALPPAVLVV